MKTYADILKETTTDIVTKVVFRQKSGHLWTNWATRKVLQNSAWKWFRDEIIWV